MIRHRLLCSALLVACAGCASTPIVRSVDVSKTGPSARKGAYLNYAVAQSLILVQISAADASGAGSAAAAKTTTGNTTQGAAQTWTLTGTLTSGTAPPAPDHSKTSPPTDSGECAVLTSDYQATQKLAAGVIANYAALEQRLAQMAGGTPADDTAAKLADEVGAYVAQLRDPGYATRLSHAPASYVQIVERCPPAVKVSITPQIAPDPSRTFALMGEPDPLYGDVLNIKSDANGLLTSSVATSADQTGNITATLATAIGEFTTASVPAPHPRANVRVKGACSDPQDAIDALRSATAQTRASRATCLLSLMPRPGTVAALPGPTGLPVTLAMTIEDLERADGDETVESLERPVGATTCASVSDGDYTAPQAISNATACLRAAAFAQRRLRIAQSAPPDDWDATQAASNAVGNLSAAAAWLGEAAALPRGDTESKGLNRAVADLILARYGVDLTIQCSDRWGETSRERDTGGHPEGVADDKWVYDGLVVSASRACRIDARQAMTQAPLASTSAWLQDSRFLTLLPMDRAALVTRSVEYDFQDGHATGVSDTRPSVAAAVVALPGNIVGAFIGGVTAAASNRNAATNAATSQLTAQTNLLNAQAQLINAQANLKAAEAAAAK